MRLRVWLVPDTELVELFATQQLADQFVVDGRGGVSDPNNRSTLTFSFLERAFYGNLDYGNPEVARGSLMSNFKSHWL